MQKISFVLTTLMLFTVLTACDQKKAQDQPSEEPATTTQTEEPTPTTETPAAEVYQTIGFRKTACFGKCPVYEVKFYTNNKATWNGKMNVERMGEYEADLSKTTIQEMRDKAHELNYFDLGYEYPTDHKIADLPTTITYVRIGDTEKTVKNTHDAPDNLQEFEEYLLSVIDALEWKPAPKD